MKPAAFVSDGESLGKTLVELRSLGAKIFATPRAHELLEATGIHAQSIADPIGLERIFNFGHKTIHLFGFDMCVPEAEGSRVCFENKIYFTNEALALHANMLVRACLELTERGANIQVHGEGMFQAMSKAVLRNATERVLNAVYDMQVCPPTYEVFSFLSQAEKYRHEHGYTHVDVMFLPGPMHGFRDDGLPPSPEARAGMLNRICVAGARLLPSVRNIHVMQRRAHIGGDVFPPDWTNEKPRFLYGPRFQINGYRCLEATAAARAEIARRFPNPYSTITLRGADYWPKRNSNGAAWSAAIRELESLGMPAVVVPDTHGYGLMGGDTFELAAWDIDLRLALYEGAELNMGVINGPMVLPMFAVRECPYIIFQKADETSPGTQEAFMAANGMKHGMQWTQNGWTLWEDDTPENVVRALKNWIGEKRAAA